MHPTVFQLKAFGELRLAPRDAAAVVLHLDRGCGRCRARVAPWLIPWLDEAPAAEARGADVERCGPTLAAELRRAARRAARAAARRRAQGSEDAADRERGRVLALLESDGPAAIGRLPRRLLGRPAVAAALRQIEVRGASDPKLRLRLAEIAWDLVERAPGAARWPRALAARAGIELANAYRGAGQFGAADRWLDRMAELLASGGGGGNEGGDGGDRDADDDGGNGGAGRDGDYDGDKGGGHRGRGRQDEAARARLDEVRAAWCAGVGRGAEGESAARRAARRYRRSADSTALARALTVAAHCARFTGDGGPGARQACAERSCAGLSEALLLLDPEREPGAVQSAVLYLGMGLVARGEGAHAAAVELRWTAVLDLLRSGRCAVQRHTLAGMIADAQGDAAAAVASFMTARRHCQAIRSTHEEGHVLVLAAASLERHGEAARAADILCAAADLFLAGDPHHELHTTAMFLRTRRHFSALREAMPLDPVGRYLERARFDQDLRLASFLD